jgi:hypothetical protein
MKAGYESAGCALNDDAVVHPHGGCWSAITSVIARNHDSLAETTALLQC